MSVEKMSVDKNVSRQNVGGSRVARFFLAQTFKNGKIYKMTRNYQKAVNYTKGS
jgi:hypothetical protein